MNILVTGNLGYIGTKLCDFLLEKKHKVFGLDAGFFINDKSIINNKIIQKLKDIRDINDKDFENIDIIVHLAALSNDPLGELSPHLTKDINYHSTIKLAEMAKKFNVKKLIYISSQSMYGVSDSKDELDEDNSPKNPVTEYAKTKWEAEKNLRAIASNDFCICYLRPSTVFGESRMLRLDIVFNNLIASAHTTNKIIIMSDGTPWRPSIHINDLCNAIIATINAPSKIINNRSYNVGLLNKNYTVRELALIAKQIYPNSELVFKNLHSDPRSYKVSFIRINKELKKFYQPEWSIERGGLQLKNYLKKINLKEYESKSRHYNRLMQIKYLIDNKKIDKELRWQKEI
tara:strand:- start:9595 stop:10629 length:1035 start_codon:yes stop_codon:yes gene_type:complete